jgi:hypothetical protein
LVVFDVSDKKTLMRTLDWKNKLQENIAPAQHKIVTYLVGNKSDLDPTFTAEELNDFALDHGFSGYMMASAKTGENVVTVLESVATGVVNGVAPIVKSPTKSTPSGESSTTAEPRPVKKDDRGISLRDVQGPSASQRIAREGSKKSSCC